MKLRVLVFAAAYPSPTEPGRAIYLENLHRALLAEAGSDLEIAVVAPRVHRADPARELRAGVAVSRFGYFARGKRLKEFRSIPWLRLAVYLAAGLGLMLREIRRRRADVLVCHWVLPSALIGRVSAACSGVPYVVFAHGSDLRRYAAGSRLAAAAARWGLGAAHRVFAVSRDLAQLLAGSLGAAAQRVAVLPMGVGEEFGRDGREAARRELALGGSTELLFVGDLIEEKGVRELALALERLPLRGTGVRLHVAGAGPLADELGRVGRAPGSPEGPSIRLLGRLAPRELARWYRGVDLLVHPSRSEGAPLVIMEALSCGLPVLATDVGGVPELVEPNKDGVLVPAGDPNALGDALAALVSTPERLAALRFGIAGRSRDFSARRRARELYPLLVEAAGNGARRLARV